MAQDPLEVFEKKRSVKDVRLFWSMNQASINPGSGFDVGSMRADTSPSGMADAGASVGDQWNHTGWSQRIPDA